MSNFITGRNFGSKIQTADLADNATTNVKMADDAIGIAELSATGTASSSTFLRGDNAWATPASSTLGSPTATTSGTTIDISIPSGTKAIWVSYDGVSPASGGEIALRLGDAGGVETSSYISYLGSYRASGNTSMDSSTTLWKLADTDWRATSDQTLSDEWKAYRKLLRDFPSTLNDTTVLNEITWPEEPS